MSGLTYHTMRQKLRYWRGGKGIRKKAKPGRSASNK